PHRDGEGATQHSQGTRASAHLDRHCCGRRCRRRGPDDLLRAALAETSMSRNLRLAHLPEVHARLRFSGFLTDPKLTDAPVTAALAPFLLNMLLWRGVDSLPKDWPVRDDSMIQHPPGGVVPFWGEGDDVTAAPFMGDPQTPWRTLAGQGQVVIENVWLYDANADPWPAPCPSGATVEKITPPKSPAGTLAAGLFGVAIGAAATAGILRWRREESC